MATVGKARSLTVQDFVPSAGWLENSNGHCLLMDLRDFKMEDVKFDFDTRGLITVSGARLSSDKCIMRFKQDFILPPESDRSRISGKFDGDIFYVMVPTIPKPPKIHKQNIHDVVEENTQETPLQNEENVNKKTKKKQGDDNGSQSDHDKKEKSRKSSETDGFGEDFVRKWGKEPCQFERVIQMLKRNNGIVITALVAFWFGVLVSRLFQCAGHKITSNLF